MGSDEASLSMDLSGLASHLVTCDAGRGGVLSLTEVGQAIKRFLAPRFVTTLFAIVPLVAVAYLVS